MFKNINTMAKNNQTLRDNIGTFIPSAPEHIIGRPRIYQTVANIKFTFDVHQSQDVYILNRPYFKWLLFYIYGYEEHIMTKTRKRQAYGYCHCHHAHIWLTNTYLIQTDH